MLIDSATAFADYVSAGVMRGRFCKIYYVSNFAEIVGTVVVDKQRSVAWYLCGYLFSNVDGKTLVAEKYFMGCGQCRAQLYPAD